MGARVVVLARRSRQLLVARLSTSGHAGQQNYEKTGGGFNFFFSFRWQLRVLLACLESSACAGQTACSHTAPQPTRVPLRPA